MKVLLVSLFDETCLGLRSISTVLKRRGHRVAIACLGGQFEQVLPFDHADFMSFTPSASDVPSADMEALQSLVRRFEPGLTGISLRSAHFDIARAVTTALRGVSSAPVIWGGIEPTANPDLSIEVADIVCVGEGEEAMADLAERLSNGRSYDDVPNLWTRSAGIDGPVARNPVRPLIQDIDSIHPFDFVPRDKFYIVGGKAWEGRSPQDNPISARHITMASRGCPYSCSYCFNSVLRGLYGAKGYVRVRSVANVIDEICQARILNPSIETVEFCDDVFAFRREWLVEFAEVYPKKVGLPFSCEIHPSVVDRDWVRLLVEAGLFLCVMGIQSGSERILRDVYHRNKPRKQIVQAAGLLTEAGVETALQVMHANPWETEEDCRDTMELLLDLPRSSSYVFWTVFGLVLFRNFPIARAFEEEGLSVPVDRTRNQITVKPRKQDAFWRSLYLLTQFPSLERDTIRALSEDPHLRANPETLEVIAALHVRATCRHPTGDRYRYALDVLNRDLSLLKGSRMARFYLKGKQWLRRICR